jgi:hypothetical protein
MQLPGSTAPGQKSDKELEQQEQEELDLALALSQSEADAKSKEVCNSLHAFCFKCMLFSLSFYSAKG